MSKGTLARLLALATRDRRAFAIAAVLVLVAAAAEVGGPLLIKVFIDEHVQTGSYPLATVLGLAGAYVVLQLIAAAAGYAQGVQLARIALAAVASLRERAFATALRLPVAWFDRTPVGAVVSRLTNDTEAVKDFYVNVLGVVVANSARVIGMAIAMLLLDWRLAIPCLAFLPAALAVMWTYQRVSGARFRAVRQALATINACAVGVDRRRARHPAHAPGAALRSRASRAVQRRTTARAWPRSARRDDAAPTGRTVLMAVQHGGAGAVVRQ
jgi:ATP-binding cassette subfamily B multidrug efflux pump